MGNRTAACGCTRRRPRSPGTPFFLYVAPHAPHLPSTPAPWYANHPIGTLKPPRTPHYNYSGTDHHALIANQPILTDADAAGIASEFSKRLRSLVSVDDIVEAMCDYLESAGELNNTFIFYTSE